MATSHGGNWDASLEINIDASHRRENEKGASGMMAKSGKPILLSSSCGVCNGPASSHNHYGAICCYSCRAFFRRGPSSRKASKCIYGTDACSINQHNRTNCKNCRYKKCISVGMIPELIDSMKTKNSPQRKIEESNEFKETKEYFEEEKINLKNDLNFNKQCNSKKISESSFLGGRVEGATNTSQKTNVQFEETGTNLKCDFNDDGYCYSPNIKETNLPSQEVHDRELVKYAQEPMSHRDLDNFRIENHFVDSINETPTHTKKNINFDKSKCFYECCNDEAINQNNEISNFNQENKYKYFLDNEISFKNLDSTECYLSPIENNQVQNILSSIDNKILSQVINWDPQKSLSFEQKIKIPKNEEEKVDFFNSEFDCKKETKEEEMDFSNLEFDSNNETKESPDIIEKRKIIYDTSDDVPPDSLIPLKKRPRMLECSYPIEHAINTKSLPVMKFTSEDKLGIIKLMFEIKSYTKLLNESLVNTFGNEQFIWLKALASGHKISHTRTEERNWMKFVQCFSKSHRVSVYPELNKLNYSERNLILSNTVPALHVLHLAMLEGNKDKNCLDQFRNTITSSIVSFFVGDFKNELVKVRGMSYKDNLRFTSPWAEKISDEEMFDNTMKKVGEIMGDDTNLQALYHMLVMITPSNTCSHIVLNDPGLRELQKGLAHLMYRYLQTRPGSGHAEADSTVHLLIMLIQELHDCANVMHHKSLEM